MVSNKSKGLINRARLEMDLRLGRLHGSIVDFFESEVRGGFLGLPQLARDHLIKFRSFLKKFYTDEYGCWPPDGFEDEAFQQKVDTTIFGDFQNLYQHLVDPCSSITLGDSDITKSGGICTHQVIQAFDMQHNHEPLAHSLPLLPQAVDYSTAGQRQRLQRRMSWHPIQKRKSDRESRKMHDKQALIKASNRDVLVMDCPLVRKFSEFEENTLDDDDLDGLSIVEGRKVRWLLVYAILQTLYAITQPPKQARNSTGLTYSLCCHPPKRLPWQLTTIPDVRTTRRDKSQLRPDTSYSHTNALKTSTGETMTRGRSARAQRRTTLPAHLPGSLAVSFYSKTPPGSRAPSLRRLMSRRSQSVVTEMPPKRPSFCEIFVEGYGNGLNEVQNENAGPAVAELTAEPGVEERLTREERNEPHELPAQLVHELACDEIRARPPLPPPYNTTMTPQTISRESSTSSTGSNWSKASDKSDFDPITPTSDAVCSLKDILRHTSSADGMVSPITQSPQSPVQHPAWPITVADKKQDDPMQMPSVHFNTQTWDLILGQIPARSSARRSMTASAAAQVAARA